MKPALVIDEVHQDRGGPRQALLEVRDLKKYFPVRTQGWAAQRKSVHAVDGVSFSVAKGQTLGIVWGSRVAASPPPRGWLPNCWHLTAAAWCSMARGLKSFGALP